MKIELHRIPVRKVIVGYKDSAEEGVVAYGGKLDIRPKYQREFVYNGKQRDAVLETIKNGFPLNVMYWVKTDEGNYEVMDGQQRTISIGQYVNGDFSLNDRFFHNLTDEEQEQILNYELMIYFCEGKDKEKLDWFKIINIAGEKLTDQELRNAVYTGSWLSDAKLKFSKSNCTAYLLANDGGQLVGGSPIRQEYLETALSWINDGKIEDYMARHQHVKNADELWNFFQNVIAWVRSVFPNYQREMSNVPWGVLYNQFKDKKFDSIVTNQVLEHVFTPNEFLSEINRVLKKDGKLLLTVPFVWDEHEQPYDYARYSSFGLAHLFDHHGFEIIQSKKSVNDFRIFAQLLNAYIYKTTQKNKVIRQLFTLFVMSIITIIGIEGINNDLFDADMILIADKKDFLFNYNIFVSSYRSNKTLIKYFDFPLLLKIKLIEC